jgi:peptidoglycan/LPS O-acetylase OafA/YrhL
LNGPSTQYRPDIDGLRALSVAFVVGYHFFPSTFKSGYVGVDVFFVISGFLITGNLIKNFENGKFSILDFYSRRINRIFPALLAVLIFVLIVGSYVLLFPELKQLGKHIAAGAGFASNFVLWQESGYFDASAKAKPLLHLWSLAIEEQFYLIWPVLLWISYCKKWKILFVAAWIGIGSFLYNLFDTYLAHSVASSYYSPLTRSWELMAGALVAIYWPRMATQSRFWRWIGPFGAALIVGGAFLIRPGAHFPGFAALLPVGGAMALIAANPKDAVNRWLSHPILVWIGLISFPLYLWHWPLISFSEIVMGDVSLPIRLLLLLTSLVLAWLTYRWIEIPLRTCRTVSKPIVLAVMMVVVGLLGFALESQNEPFLSAGIPLHQANDLDLKRYFEILAGLSDVCEPAQIRKKAHVYEGVVRCRQKTSTLPQTLALIGDSHAEHFVFGIMKQARSNENPVYFTYSTLPFLNLKRLNSDAGENMQEALEYIAHQPSIRQVVLSDFWNDRMIEDDIRPIQNLQEKDRALVFVNGLKETLQLLISSGKEVTFAYDVPDYGFDPLKCIRPLSQYFNPKCSISLDEVRAHDQTYRGLVKQVLRDFPQVKEWDPIPLLCPEGKCSAVMNDQLVIKDTNNHLTMPFSLLLSESLLSVVRSPRTAGPAR